MQKTDDRAFCCDLACECGKLASLPFEREEEDYLYCSVSRVNLSEEASRLVDRPAGRYVSIFFGNLWELGEDAESEISQKLANEIVNITKNLGFGKEKTKILVSGLGNGEITHDSLGRKTCEALLPCEEMSVFCVGVAGKSGIDSADLIKAVARCAHADVVIAIDSLTARGSERVGRVIQLSDSGINPGSGIGKHLKGVNRSTVGVPVISVGVALALAAQNFDEEGYVSVPEKLLSILDTSAKIISKALNNVAETLKPNVE